MDEHDTRRDLVDALQAVVDDGNTVTASARRAPPGPPTARRNLSVLVAAGAVLLAWLWIARPAAVFAPGTPAIQSAEQREAIARFALYLERARVDQFVAERGRMPTTLAEAGEVEAGVQYHPEGRDFTLDIRDCAIQLRLTNRMNADSFLGDALGRIPKPNAQ